MIRNSNYIYGFVTALMLLIMLSASPPVQPFPYKREESEDQKKNISDQKGCLEKIQTRQKEIAAELIKIRDMLKKD
tara:strand:+ start:401 stop:628 length:228 start_codon:yes stop_codon:yes gene_type:complete